MGFEPFKLAFSPGVLVKMNGNSSHMARRFKEKCDLSIKERAGPSSRGARFLLTRQVFQMELPWMGEDLPGWKKEPWILPELSSIKLLPLAAPFCLEMMK